MTLVLVAVLFWLGLNVAVVLADFALVAREDRVARRRAGTPGAATVARPDGLQPH